MPITILAFAAVLAGMEPDPAPARQERTNGGSMTMRSTQADDFEAIRRLHEADEAASRAQDFATLRTLMDDEAVVLEPGAAPVRGRAALDESFARRRGQPRTMEIIDYHFEWEELEVVGDRAIEWGRIVGSFRPADGGAPVDASYNVLRVLRRQADGGWRIYRTIWNEAPAR